ncbi:MAG: hypothetical protein HYZ57_06685 [Acidobacteria bacterium]|nr:hypothetical protein [Acidobacteriota bacterium]
MKKRLLTLLVGAAMVAAARDGWWMREPIRWVQTNLRETDAALDPARLAGQLADFKANVLLFGMGGIVAFYPTRADYHYASPHMPAGRDTFGEMLRQAHARGIRVVGRFDLSKTPKAVYDAHPEWFFRRASGEPVVYNGLYSTCINGGWYRGKRRFRERYGRELPVQPDADYRQFMFDSSREVAAEIAKLIRAKRPKAGFFTYIQEHTDGIMSESNTAVARPLPLWPYASSDNVNRARNSQPGKMAVNLCMPFVDFPWRFATVPPREIAIRLWQNVAHGGAAALNMHGTMDQQDGQALAAARPIYRWLAENEQYYAGQESAARVLLLGRPHRSGRGFSQSAYRGLFRLLTEEHVPFAVADNLEWMKDGRAFDLVIAADWAPAELDGYIRAGGRVLIASAQAPEFAAGAIVRRWPKTQGYMRVREPSLFPSLKSTSLLMLNSEYVELEPEAKPLLTLIPPSMFGPPEKVHVDQVETNKPGLLLRGLGRGRLAWVPWDIGSLYYQHSLAAHGGLLRDLIDHLLAAGRQMRTNAHPLVEISVMRQKGRTLLHFVNLSGHADTAYFEAVPMRDVRVELRGRFSRARAVRGGQTLAAAASGEYTAFTVPVVGDYELVVLE